jgi:ABC-2 type transport system ATP-binding protein
MLQAMLPIEASELRKTYTSGVEAIRGISFGVQSGEIFGLLGPNGAGKTTTVGVLTTLVAPTGGSARVAGKDVVADPLAVRRAIGVLFQDSVLDNDFTALQNLRLHARLWRVPEPGRRIESMLTAVGLADRAGDLVRTFSGGMRRRLEIARALLATPQVLFLDEPTLGLDPIVRRDLWHVIESLRERYGVTIMLSTHYLEEAQGVCDRVGIIDNGELIAEGRPQQLVAALGQQIVELTLDGDDRPVLASLGRLDETLGVPLKSGAILSIPSSQDAQTLTTRLGALRLAELGVDAMTVRPATLNDVFLHLTTHRSSHDLTAATTR